MGLINYKTNLKSLKFGKDRPGGGSSNQPYETVSIPEDRSGGNAIGNILDNGGLVLSRSARDVSRMTKYFTDTKSLSGVNFILNQNLLARQSADITAGTKNYKPLTFPGGLYTPLNTLMQVGEVGFGAHYKKQGVATNGGLLGSAIGFIDSALNLNVVDGLVQQHEYVKVTKDPNNSRLRNLYLTKGYVKSKMDIASTITGNKINSFKTYVNNSISPFGLNTDGLLNSLSKVILSKDLLAGGDVLYEYNGGPSLTKTKIKRYVDTRNGSTDSGKKIYSKYKSSNAENYLPLNLLSIKYLKGTDIVTYDKAGDYHKGLSNVRISKGMDTKTNPGDSNLQSINFGNKSNDFMNIKDIADNENNKVNGFPKVVDFRHLVDKRFPSWGGVKLYDSNDKSYSRIGMNDPTHRIKQIPNKDSDEWFQQVNDFSRSKYVVDEITILGKNKDKSKDDLIKFRIGILDRNGGDPEYIQFRAYIDSFDDNYQAEFTDQAFMGRGEKFYKYNGFNRDIGLSFTVAALSKPELIPMYKKLNYLASLMAPNYGDNGYMSGNMINLTIGGYLYEVPGFLQGLTIAPHEESPWEIGLGYNVPGKGYDNEVKELPLVIKVTGFRFKPVHDFTPKIQKDYEKGTTRFISLSAGSNNNNYDN